MPHLSLLILSHATLESQLLTAPGVLSSVILSIYQRDIEPHEAQMVCSEQHSGEVGELRLQIHTLNHFTTLLPTVSSYRSWQKEYNIHLYSILKLQNLLTQHYPIPFEQLLLQSFCWTRDESIIK